MATATATKLPAFAVDKKGLAKLLARKGKGFAVTELVQNAWDENTTRVDVTLERLDNDLWRLVVQDDNPEGFADLSHAYTLFAESLKKGDASKRGRFNLGEKLVIAVCEQASIATTKGTILFAGEHRVETKAKRKSGSVFTGDLRLTDEESKEIEGVVHTLLPPHGITTTFNLIDVPQRTPLRTFEVTLRTEIADDEGRLKPTARKTQVEIYTPVTGEVASIYEMGIPIVETGDRFHVNIQQKVPLPTDRDNVTPGYLRDVRVAVLNACYDLLTAEDGKAAWVTNAMEDESVTAQALQAAFSAKFGDKAVVFDPNDQQANKQAAAAGYTVVPGGALPKAAWQQIKSNDVVKPAGQVTPSLNALLNLGGDNEKPLKTMERDHWPSYIESFTEFACALAEKLTGRKTTAKIGNDPTYPAAATWCNTGPGTAELMLNVGRLGHKWFEQVGEKQLDLLLDEFGHAYASDHLDEAYYKALRSLGARMTMLALAEPEFFAAYGAQTAQAVA